MDELKTVPYIVVEALEARAERRTKRLITALIISIIVGLLNNFAWMWLWNQYEYVDDSETRIFTQDGEGLNIIEDANEVTNEPDSDLYQDEEAPSEKE